MRKRAGYGVIKYHGYIIEGNGRDYELYLPEGLIGHFPTCKDAKEFVDRERQADAEAYNMMVLDSLEGYI